MLRTVLPLLLLTSCLQQAKDRVRALLGQETQQVETATSETPEFKPEPPPAIEQDNIVKVSPKERLLTLFEQFNRTPDAASLQVVLTEFNSHKNVFTNQLDLPLKSVLNRTIPNIQQGDYNTLQLLTQLLPVLTGENKDHLFNVLANYFESSPTQLAEVMSKRPEDKFCTFALQVPSSISPEDKRNFLEARMIAIAAAKETVGNNFAVFNYLEACWKGLGLQLGTQTAAPAEPAADPVAPSTEPAAPSASEPAAPQAPPAPTP